MVVIHAVCKIINGDLVSGPSTGAIWFDSDNNPHLDEVTSSFKVAGRMAKKTAFGLNEQRRSNMAVLYTPSYGPRPAPTWRELILEKDGDSPWCHFQAGQPIGLASGSEDRWQHATRVRCMVLSLALDWLTEYARRGVRRGSGDLHRHHAPDLKGVKTAIVRRSCDHQGWEGFSLKDPPPGTSGNYGERSKYERHPRSAVGWSTMFTHEFLASGRRQPGPPSMKSNIRHGGLQPTAERGCRSISSVAVISGSARRRNLSAKNAFPSLMIAGPPADGRLHTLQVRLWRWRSPEPAPDATSGIFVNSRGAKTAPLHRTESRCWPSVFTSRREPDRFDRLGVAATGCRRPSRESIHGHRWRGSRDHNSVCKARPCWIGVVHLKPNAVFLHPPAYFE